jgi:hypothetical protein
MASKLQVISRDGQHIPLASKDGELRPAFQMHATLGHQTEYTIPISPTAPTTCLSNGSIVYFDLEPSECSLIEDYPEFRFKLTNGGASPITLPPIFYWFRRILIEEGKGTGDELCRLYPESWVAWFMSLNEERRDYYQKRCGFSLAKNPENGSMSLGYTSNSTTIRAGETRYLYLPIIWLPFSQKAIDMEHISAELRFTLEFATSVGISGTMSDLSVADISLIIKSFEEYGADKHERHSRMSGKQHKYIYLDYHSMIRPFPTPQKHASI